MKKRISLILVSLFTILLFASACSSSYDEGSDQILDNLNINMDLKKDGSMDVTEIWKLDLSDREKPYRNVYKSFKIDSSKAGNITNFSVYDIDKDLEYTLKTVKDPSKNDNYGLTNVCYMYQNGDYLELGLYMPEIDQGIRNFKFNYTVTDAITVYNDVAVSYYQQIGPSFSLPINHMNCEINIPDNTDKESLRAWLHCKSESNLSIDSAQKISFTADEIPKETMIETRVCMPTNLFSESTRIVNDNVFESILNEEAKWQSDYEAYLRKQYILGLVDIVAGSAFVLMGVVYYIIKREKNRHFQLEVPQYIRDIPKGETPGTMSEVYYYYKGGITKNKRGRVFSATILNLACKKYLSIEKVQELSNSKKGDTFKIKVHPLEGIGELKESEKVFLDLLNNVSKAHNNTFTMNDFEIYAKRQYKYVDYTIDRFFDLIKEECVEKSYIEEKGNSVFAKQLATLSIIVSVMFLVFWGFFVYIPVGIILGSIVVLLGTSIKPRLLIDGEKAFLTWKGLERFMLEFSRMKEYSTMELALWEEYLVYATAMGISDKVCKQLKMVYRELNDPVYVDDNFENTLLFWMLMDNRYSGYHNSGMNFGDALANRINTISTSATRLAHPVSTSSGSGSGFGGGGFSGGGGGFGGGGGGVR